MKIRADKLFVNMCRFAAIDDRLRGQHFRLKSYLKFVQGCQAASLARGQLKLSRRELEYT